MEVYKGNDTLNIDTLYYSFPDSAVFKLDGIHLGDTLEVKMHTREKDDFRLINRGFHWVNEYPYNR